MFDPTTQADIDRLLTTVRTDQEAARAEIETRLAEAGLSPSFRHQLLLLKATGHLETGELAPALATARAVLIWAVAENETLTAGRAVIDRRRSAPTGAPAPWLKGFGTLV
ncbi:MAG: hypothetical protein IT582_00180 [Opitutaceae bacterium]|nr:hypothetical protein [Opitutaceae bacterium]